MKNVGWCVVRFFACGCSWQLRATPLKFQQKMGSPCVDPVSLHAAQALSLQVMEKHNSSDHKSRDSSIQRETSEREMRMKRVARGIGTISFRLASTAHEISCMSPPHKSMENPLITSTNYEKSKQVPVRVQKIEMVKAFSDFRRNHVLGTLSW